MTQKKAEILLAAVIAARATSLLFSKIAMNGMGIFNLLAARFLMAFVLLAVVFFKLPAPHQAPYAGAWRHHGRSVLPDALHGADGAQEHPLLHRLPAGEYRHHSCAHGGGRAAA